MKLCKISTLCFVYKDNFPRCRVLLNQVAPDVYNEARTDMLIACLGWQEVSKTLSKTTFSFDKIL